MKTRTTLDRAEMVALLRFALPIFGYDLDNEVHSPMQVRFGRAEQLRYGQRETVNPSQIVAAINIRTYAPWLPSGHYKSVLLCDLYELREILRQALKLQGVMAEMFTFEVRRVLGIPHLVAEYIA